jgi:hypothetical protein
MSTKTIELTADVQNAVELAKSELGEMLAGQGKIVKRIGEALLKDPSVGETPEKVCVTIKHLLAAEIEQGIISVRTIEEACPAEWKNKARAESGSRGGAETAAKREKGDSGGTAAQVNELENRMNKLEEKFDTLKSKASELVKAGEQDGDYMRVPKQVFAELAEAVNG